MKLAGLLAACLLSATPAFARDGDADVRAEIARRLALDAHALQADLSRLGAGGIPALFDVLAGGGVPGSWAADGVGVALDPERRAAVLGALAALPAKPLREHLAAVAAEPERTERRTVAALEVLALAGGAADAALCVQLVAPDDRAGDAPPGAARGVPRAQRVALEAALAAIAARDDGTIFVLKGMFTSLHPALLASAVRCIASTASPDRLGVLASLLDRMPGIDALLLTEIARVGEHAPRPVDRQVCVAVRYALESRDASESVLAARALGVLDDFDAFPRLIALLGAEDARLRSAADEALARMSGRAFRGSARAWQLWYGEELAWWNGAAATLRAVDHPDPAVALAALQDVSGHRLYRHELAAAVAVALDRPERELVLLGCSILSSLASPVAVPALLAALERPAEVEREAARKALRALTGIDGPKTAAEWRLALEREIPSSRG